MIQEALTYHEGETGKAKRRLQRLLLLPQGRTVPAGDGDAHARWGKISGTLTGRTSVVHPGDPDDDDDPVGTAIHYIRQGQIE